MISELKYNRQLAYSPQESYSRIAEPVYDE